MFEIFCASGRSDHLVASRNRWVNHQKKMVEQQEIKTANERQKKDIATKAILAGLRHVKGLQQEC